MTGNNSLCLAEFFAATDVEAHRAARRAADDVVETQMQHLANTLGGDLPRITWFRDTSKSELVGWCLNADEMVAWAATLGLARNDDGSPGYTAYTGSIGSVRVRVAGITDRAMWEAHAAEVEARFAKAQAAEVTGDA